MNDHSVTNWEGSILSHPKEVVSPNSIDQVVEVLTDPERYPSPVRAVGSNHSTTRCGVADGGTLLVMSRMDRIIEVGEDYVTAEAGALYIDVARHLEAKGKQFHVNVELGNLSMGSAACGGTKDASMPEQPERNDPEFGQVCSYATGFKLVAPSGEILEVEAGDPEWDELIPILRSSYGLLGVICEVTFRIKPLTAISYMHRTYSLESFCRQLPDLVAQGRSMMLYVFPFLNSVTVEYRWHNEGASFRWVDRKLWQFRNFVWRSFAPRSAYLITRFIRYRAPRDGLINLLNRAIQFVLNYLHRGSNSNPNDQIIRYPEEASNSKYTFSLWAFPEAKYPEVIKLYVKFCRDHYRERGFRCNLLNVGYRIRKDRSSLFSYSYDGDVITIDPVSTGADGWDEFLVAYNAFCNGHGGVPLFNQTKWLTAPQVKRAFGGRLADFEACRKRFDPKNRLLNDYFGSLLDSGETGKAGTTVLEGGA